MLPIRLSAMAEDDLVAIQEWTVAHFGERAADLYDALLEAAFHDIARDPLRTGSTGRNIGGADIRLWPIRLSSERIGHGRSARHLLIYRLEPEVCVKVGRILHDSMDLPRHLSDPRIWS